MPESIGPAIAREKLRARLRELRESRGLSPEPAEDQLSWPESVSGSEHNVPSPQQLEDLLAAYGADGLTAENLRLLGHIARSRLSLVRSGISDAYQHFVAYEAEATRISAYQPLAVPPLLQTSRYALAATAAVLRLPEDHPDVVTRATVRDERQSMIRDRLAAGQRVELVVILDEVVLRRGFGGNEVMREQLSRIAGQARLDHMTLVVLRTAQGGHAGLAGAFELAEYDGSPEISTVFIESATEDWIVRGSRVADYRQIVDDLRSAGVQGDDAIALVDEIRDEI